MQKLQGNIWNYHLCICKAAGSCQIPQLLAANRLDIRLLSLDKLDVSRIIIGNSKFGSSKHRYTLSVWIKVLLIYLKIMTQNICKVQLLPLQNLKWFVMRPKSYKSMQYVSKNILRKGVLYKYSIEGRRWKSHHSISVQVALIDLVNPHFLYCLKSAVYL